MTAPRISIALPVYNGANYIREALDSILAQDFTDFELVVSDNCSTDETAAILAEYAQRDTRIRVSRSDTFLPQVPNVNRAISLCSGEWVKLFCHDDLMQPGCLRTIIEAIDTLSTPATGLLSNGETYLFTNGSQYSFALINAEIRLLNGREYVRDVLNGRSNVGLPALTTATVRKTAFQQFGGFDQRFIHFDTFYWHILLSAWDFITIPQSLTVNRIHGAQVAVSARKSLRSVEDQKIFWPEFISNYSDIFGLTTMTHLKLALKPLAVAGSIIATEILKGGAVSALKMYGRLPIYWWFMLPPFIVRSLRLEQARLRAFGNGASPSMIYP